MAPPPTATHTSENCFEAERPINGAGFHRQLSRCALGGGYAWMALTHKHYCASCSTVIGEVKSKPGEVDNKTVIRELRQGERGPLRAALFH